MDENEICYSFKRWNKQFTTWMNHSNSTHSLVHWLSVNLVCLSSWGFLVFTDSFFSCQMHSLYFFYCPCPLKRHLSSHVLGLISSFYCVCIYDVVDTEKKILFHLLVVSFIQTNHLLHKEMGETWWDKKLSIQAHLLGKSGFFYRALCFSAGLLKIVGREPGMLYQKNC